MHARTSHTTYLQLQIWKVATTPNITRKHCNDTEPADAWEVEQGHNHTTGNIDL